MSFFSFFSLFDREQSITQRKEALHQTVGLRAHFHLKFLHTYFDEEMQR